MTDPDGVLSPFLKPFPAIASFIFLPLILNPKVQKWEQLGHLGEGLREREEAAPKPLGAGESFRKRIFNKMREL